MEGFTVTCSPSYYVLVTLLTLFIFSSNTKSCLAANTTNALNKTSTEFIRTSCAATSYPDICFNSLSSYASSVQTSHLKLAYVALTISLKRARSTSAMVSKLSRRHDLKSSELAAVKDCVEEIGDSIDELQQSLKQMKYLGGSDVDFKMSNIKTWVSAAITDQDTCMDGFEGDGLNVNVKSTIRKSILGLAKLTSNGLALINSLTSSELHSN